MKKKTITWILVGATVLIVLLLIGKKVFGKDSNIKEVEITKIEPIDITETVAATGKIQPEIEVMLSSEVSGEIIELPVKEGQQVEKGDLLVRINPDLIQSALSQAQAGLQNARAGLAQTEASLKNAELNYNRNKMLFDKGVISKSEWDRIVADYEMAKANKEAAYFTVQSASANVKQGQDNLTRTTIYAPMSGTISKLSVELGERVVGTAQMAGTEIIRVANLSNMEVEVDVNENDIVKVQIGDSTLVEVDAYLKRQFHGVVTEIANSAETTLSADQVTNFKVKVRILANSYKDLTEGKPEHFSPFRPGMTATVDIITEKKRGVIGVPISAVVIKTDTSSVTHGITKPVDSDSDEKFECVFVKEGDIAKLRVIKTGIQDDSNIEIRSGLSVDEIVIIGPYNLVTKTLKNGDKVTEETPKKEEEIRE
jgi:HlyD family secretion protein